MMMNEMKTNTGKLLAAIMIMAVMIAGAAVVFSDSDVSAATISEDLESLGTSDVASLEGGNYYAVPNTTAVNVTTTAASSTSKIYLENGASVKITALGSSSTVTFYAATDGTSTTAPKNFVEGLSVVATAGITVQNNNGVLVATGAEAGSNSEIGISATTAQNTTYYAQGANQSITLSESGDSVTVTNGTATVRQGNNNVTISNIEASTGSGITVTYSAEMPAISGTIEGDEASVTVTGGSFSFASTIVGTAGVLNAVAVDSTTDYYTNQIVADADATAYTINGTITQRTSVELADDDALSLEAGAKLIINNNVTVNAQEYTDTASKVGTIIVYGTLIGNTTSEISATEDVFYIGPNGSIDGINATNISNTNVNNFEDNTFISGEYSGSPTGDFIIEDDGRGLTIPEGATLTISGNLGLNGETLKVNGTLVIENRATSSTVEADRSFSELREPSRTTEQSER